ncbi:MAG: radical SAM protein [candidate division WOR-3 bacterium]
MLPKRHRLVLINPVNPKRRGFTANLTSRFPPLALGIIAALTPDDWEIKLIDENFNPFFFEDADLVGITAYTASANRAYEISAIYRQRSVPVVMGGMHATICPEEALRYVDAVVIGEVESIWNKIIYDFKGGGVKGIYHGELIDGRDIPHPRHDLFHKDYLFGSVQTSRGCPMDCDFCSVPAYYGKKYRRRPLDKVIDELINIKKRFIFFIDDNIIGYGSDSRDEAIAIFKEMVNRKLNKWWICQASLNFADDEEVLYWASRSGCKMVIMGLEARETEALIEANKRLNLKRGIDFYKKAFDRIHRAGIAIVGSFIFGFDSDTEDIIYRRARYLLESDIDVMQITYLTPLPGTRLFERLYKEGRLLYTDYPRDWDHFDVAELTYKPRKISSKDLTSIMQDIHRQVYSWDEILHKAIVTYLRTRDPIASSIAFYSNLNYAGAWAGRRTGKLLPIR